jgi:hypothetical protein
MRSYFSLAALVLLRPVLSLDVLVTKPVTCSSSLPISFNFTSLGENNSNILTFGQAAPVAVVGELRKDLSWQDPWPSWMVVLHTFDVFGVP